MALKQAHQMVWGPDKSVSSSRLGTMHPLSPPGAAILCFAFEAKEALDRAHRSARSRTQANKVKLRRSTGATGHNEGTTADASAPGRFASTAVVSAARSVSSGGQVAWEGLSLRAVLS